jgi:asparagine synthase (glutamine-hydrolysing)
MLIHGARDRATVFLCGHGGDEVLGGYRLSQDRFRLALLRTLQPFPEAWTRGPTEHFLYGDEPLGERRAALRRASAAETPAAARYLIHRPLPPDDVRLLLGGALPPPERYLATVDRLYAECGSDATDLDRMQEVMLRTFLSENILSFADSVAMDSSAELRMPFLDRDLVAFALSLPAGERVSRWPGRANTKLVLRAWAKRRMPAEIVRRRKRSFQFGILSDLLRHDGPALRHRILGPTAVRRALPGAEAWLGRAPSSYRGPWEGTLWALLALAAWCDAADIG